MPSNGEEGCKIDEQQVTSELKREPQRTYFLRLISSHHVKKYDQLEEREICNEFRFLSLKMF